MSILSGIHCVCGLAPKVIRTGIRAIAATALVAMSVSTASANNTQTVMTSDAYVPLNIARAFVTMPNDVVCLGDAGIGTQDDVTACNELGKRAAAAANGTGVWGDVYFEPAVGSLTSTAAFVPQNPINMNATPAAAYERIFTNHKYDLFGSGTDNMGMYNREELQILVIDLNLPVPSQTAIGDNSLFDLMTILLQQPEGSTTFNISGIDHDFADMELFQELTGFTSGKGTTIYNHCLTLIPPPFGLIYCAVPDNAADVYIFDQLPFAYPDQCTSVHNTLVNNANCQNRDVWVDQTVVGYLQAWEELGGDQSITQNFRNQTTFDAHLILDAANTRNDQRWEQSVELSATGTSVSNDAADGILGNLETYNGSRQTMQSAMETLGDSSGGLATHLGELITQDVNGYFFSCVNCDTPELELAGATHAFEPTQQTLFFMPYTTQWNVIPTITHAPSAAEDPLRP